MTRIVVDPPTVRDAATGLRTAASELESTAGALRGHGLPPMPGFALGDVLGVLGTVVPALYGVAGEYRTIGGDLDGRVDRAETMSDYAIFLRAFAIAGSPFALNDMVEESASVLRIVRGMHSGALGRIAAAESAVATAEVEDGAQSLTTLNAYMRWQETVSRLVPLRSAEQASEYFAKPGEALRIGTPGVEASRVGTFLRVGGKTLGVLGIGVNTVIAVHGSPYHGARGDVDRVFSGFGAAAGVAYLTPIATMVPGGAVVIGVVLIGVAAWGVGNLVYDYRHEIAHGTVAVGREMWNHRNLALDATVPGYVFWDQRREFAHVAAGGEHLVGSGLHDMASAGGAVGGGVSHGYDTVKHILGF